MWPSPWLHILKAHTPCKLMCCNEDVYMQIHKPAGLHLHLTCIASRDETCSSESTVCSQDESFHTHRCTLVRTVPPRDTQATLVKMRCSPSICCSNEPAFIGTPGVTGISAERDLLDSTVCMPVSHLICMLVRLRLRVQLITSGSSSLQFGTSESSKLLLRPCRERSRAPAQTLRTLKLTPLTSPSLMC